MSSMLQIFVIYSKIAQSSAMRLYGMMPLIDYSCVQFEGDAKNINEHLYAA